MRICKIEGCNEKHWGKGYCKYHYRKARERGEFGSTICKVVGCQNIVHAKGYCKKHSIQIWRHGHIQERTCRDANIFIKNGKIIKIILFNSKHKKIAETMIDKQDINLIKKYKWHLCHGYPKAEKNGKHIIMGQLLLQPPKGFEADHKDRNPLNNCRSNLRIATSSQNSCNQGITKINTSGFKGVCKPKNAKKWLAQICVRNNKRVIGRFDNLMDAAIAYDKAVIQYHGEFALTNKMLGLL